MDLLGVMAAVHNEIASVGTVRTHAAPWSDRRRFPCTRTASQAL